MDDPWFNHSFSANTHPNGINYTVSSQSIYHPGRTRFIKNKYSCSLIINCNLTFTHMAFFRQPQLGTERHGEEEYEIKVLCAVVELRNESQYWSDLVHETNLYKSTLTSFPFKLSDYWLSCLFCTALNKNPLPPPLTQLLINLMNVISIMILRRSFLGRWFCICIQFSMDGKMACLLH